MQTDFTLNNLPYGVFKPVGSSNPGRIGVAIADKILDLHSLATDGKLHRSLSRPKLNDFMATGPAVWSEERSKIRLILESIESHNPLLIPQIQCEMLLPADIPDYTDFYASEEHATNVGIMFRGRENALMPNWKSLPVGYHGRSSSIRACPDGTSSALSGTEQRKNSTCDKIIRPRGQFRKADQTVFGPTEELDFELELACFIGGGNKLGEPIPLAEAEQHIFGFVLMNDWSARDIQRWEYQPLGPFLGKNFGTTISPWIVPAEALGNFRVPGKPQSDPLPYLRYDEKNAQSAGLDIDLQVSINGTVVTRSNPKHLYWTFAQQIAHHTVNGCNLRPGDLIASGTISAPDGFGSMLELSWNKTRKIEIGESQSRVYLEDGDVVNMTGWFGGRERIGFGNCRGVVLPSKST